MGKSTAPHNSCNGRCERRKGSSFEKSDQFLGKDLAKLFRPCFWNFSIENMSD